MIRQGVMILIVFIMIAYSAKAQNSIDTIINAVAKNNISLQAKVKYWEAQKLQFHTGNTLYDPTVSYDYMRGTPYVTAGNQVDFNVLQSFDFPTVYAKKRQLANELTKQSDNYLAADRQDILLNAQQVCINLIYQYRLKAMIIDRKTRTEQFVSNFQKRLEEGQGNILDVNKAKLQLIEINKEYQLNQSEINRLKQKLTALNGGIEILYADTLYPVFQAVPEFDVLVAEKAALDPIKKYMEQQSVIAKKQVGVTKALSLPKFEAGYHYQGILGQRFYGGKVGMSVPLWENKNRVKQKKAEVYAVDVKLDEYENQLFYDVKQQYEKYASLKATVEEYRSVLNSINSIRLLDKALAYGEITTMQYFVEAGYYYEATDNYLRTEKEYYEAVVELFKHQL